MSKPFFSVVIPTRTRAKLLPLAVQSVLNQTFGDFEIIVSDNFSADETPQVGQSFDDKRVKYFRSEKPLSICESLEFATSHATGEYLTVLSDDDAYARVFLERLTSVIEKEKTEVVSCKLAYYYAREMNEYGRIIPSRSLVIRAYNRKLHALKRTEALTALFATGGLTAAADDWKAITFPLLVNSAVKASLIEKVKTRISTLFPIIGSDIYSSALFLNAAEKFCYIDEPLYLHRIWEEGITSSGLANFQKHAEPLEYVPLKKLVTVQNYHADAFLRAVSDWGADFQKLPMDLSSYFINYYQEIKDLQAKGIDVSAELAEFEREVLKQDKNLQDKIRLAKSSVVNSAKTILKSRLKDSFFGRTALKLKYRELTVLNSEDHKFSDILECAAKIDEDFLDKYARR
jgi:glycosyltransferase involved in cell wall biosynthesis